MNPSTGRLLAAVLLGVLFRRRSPRPARTPDSATTPATGLAAPRHVRTTAEEGVPR